MKRALWILALGGCNAIFGLDQTRAIDAAVSIDAAPAVCPAIGSGPPTFAPNPTVFGGMHCVAYTTSAIRATAVTLCETGLVEGLIGSSVFEAVAITGQAGFTLTSPRLSPNGDELFAVARPATPGGPRELQRYRRLGTGAFQFAETIPLSGPEALQLESVSPPSATADQHLIVHLFDTGGTSTFVELYEKSGSGWSELRRETRAQVGTESMGFPSLSPDGLRLVFSGSLPVGGAPNILYRERASVADAFGPPVIIGGVDANRLWPHLAPDCSRLYFSRIDALEYVSQ